LSINPFFTIHLFHFSCRCGLLALCLILNACSPQEPNLLLPEFVPIPAGQFMQGSDIAPQLNEKPAKQRSVAAFEMMPHEVTRAQFGAFVAATGYKTEAEKGRGCYYWLRNRYELASHWQSPGIAQTDDHPVVCIKLSDAHAYAKWVGQVTQRKVRLPTETEWEYAAAGGNPANRYPWGGQMARGKANCFECGSQWDNTSTAPVGQFPANGYGLFDMAGNAYELVATEYTSNYSLDAPSINLDGLGIDPVVRGGSWSSPPSELEITRRSHDPTQDSYADIGFRLVRDIE
jgi:formylglycine-generating enzyme required for sulfatase activity